MNKIVVLVMFISVFIFSSCTQNAVGEPLDVEATTEIKVSVEVGDEVEATVEEDSPSLPASEVIMAPQFTLMSSTGEPVSLSDYEGKIVFINFWTTWCKYCLQEMPDFQEAYEKYGDDLAILLVNVTTDANEMDEAGVIAWYDQFGYTMPMVLDVDGAVVSQYPVQAYPTTYFVNRDGSMIAYYPGAMTPELIDQVMSEFK